MNSEKKDQFGIVNMSIKDNKIQKMSVHPLQVELFGKRSTIRKIPFNDIFVLSSDKNLHFIKFDFNSNQQTKLRSFLNYHTSEIENLKFIGDSLFSSEIGNNVNLGNSSIKELNFALIVKEAEIQKEKKEQQIFDKKQEEANIDKQIGEEEKIDDIIPSNPGSYFSKNLKPDNISNFIDFSNCSKYELFEYFLPLSSKQERHPIDKSRKIKMLTYSYKEKAVYACDAKFLIKIEYNLRNNDFIQKQVALEQKPHSIAYIDSKDLIILQTIDSCCIILYDRDLNVVKQIEGLGSPGGVAFGNSFNLSDNKESTYMIWYSGNESISLIRKSTLSYFRVDRVLQNQAKNKVNILQMTYSEKLQKFFFLTTSTVSTDTFIASYFLKTRQSLSLKLGSLFSKKKVVKASDICLCTDQTTLILLMSFGSGNTFIVATECKRTIKKAAKMKLIPKKWSIDQKLQKLPMMDTFMIYGSSDICIVNYNKVERAFEMKFNFGKCHSSTPVIGCFSGDSLITFGLWESQVQELRIHNKQSKVVKDQERNKLDLDFMTLKAKFIEDNLSK